MLEYLQAVKDLATRFSLLGKPLSQLQVNRALGLAARRSFFAVETQPPLSGLLDLPASANVAVGRGRDANRGAARPAFSGSRGSANPRQSRRKNDDPWSRDSFRQLFKPEAFHHALTGLVGRPVLFKVDGLILLDLDQLGPITSLPDFSSPTHIWAILVISLACQPTLSAQSESAKCVMDWATLHFDAAFFQRWPNRQMLTFQLGAHPALHDLDWYLDSGATHHATDDLANLLTGDQSQCGSTHHWEMDQVYRFFTPVILSFTRLYIMLNCVMSFTHQKLPKISSPFHDLLFHYARLHCDQGAGDGDRVVASEPDWEGAAARD